MLNCTLPNELKRLVYACNAFLYWFDEFDTEGEYTALTNETDAINRIRQLVPKCLSLITNDAVELDCE